MPAVDYPGAIPYWAHPSNYYLPANHGGIANRPRGFVLHTPEEPWDNYESTPVYFAAPNRQASTHYYMDSDGDVYQIVPENCAAIANGVLGKPYPRWANPNTSLNWQSLSVEIEGYAASVGQTLIPGQPQFNGLVRLIKHRAAAWDFPTDRQHIIGHYEVANNRSDPGAGFPWAALMAALNEQEEDDEGMKAHSSTAEWFTGRLIAGGSAYYVMQTQADFFLPDAARDVFMEVRQSGGHTSWFDGLSTTLRAECDGYRVFWVRMADARPGTDDLGKTVNFRVDADVQFETVKCLAWN